MSRQKNEFISMDPSALSITIPPMDYEVMSANCSEEAYEDDDHISCSGSLTSCSQSISGSSPTTTSRSLSSFGDSPGNGTSSSLSSDLELINLACAAFRQRPIEMKALSLSTNIRKHRRPLKSLKALFELTNLTQLDLSGNSVERLDGIQLLTQLQILAIPRNHLKTLSAPIFSLKQLTNLDLSGNFIAHLPRAFSGLTMLEVLNLSGNNLNTLREVDVLAPLGNLLSCSLAANPFCRLPTYKDFIICKIRSLERLDEVEISQATRDRAAKRFSSAMFSKDLFFREAEQVHEDKQNRLLETQSALEAENLRLKGELQVKSKLLQNKSRAWSSATEQLLQLQQEVAMLNLDRSQEVLPYKEEICDIEQITMAIATSQKISYPSQQIPRSALRFPSPKRSVKKRRDSLAKHELQFAISQRVDGGEKRVIMASDVNEILERSQGKTFVDASCSPLRTIPIAISTNLSSDIYDDADGTGKEEGKTEQQGVDKNMPTLEKTVQNEMSFFTPSVANVAFPQELWENVNSVNQIEETSWKLDTNMESEISTSVELELKEEDQFPIHDLSSPIHDLRFGQIACFPAFEDELACPAYEDASQPALHSRSLSASVINSRVMSMGTESAPDAYPSVSQSLPPSPTSSPSKVREWYRKQGGLRLPTPPSYSPKEATTSPKFKAPSRGLEVSPLALFADKETLARRIQALQTCKQSLLAQIRNEEHLLHVLKQESARYADQIDCLTVNIEACIDNDPSVICLSFSPPSSPWSKSKKLREEEIGRTRLEILRKKLQFAEDKEKEIEASMVRMTKRVLHAELNPMEGRGSNSVPPILNVPYDKEIFALTNKLQLVFVEKEEIHMRMNHLMASLKDEADLNIDREESGASSKQAQTLVKSRQMVDEYRTRHRGVISRIELKQKLLSALLMELEEVEDDLKQISSLNESSAQSPLFQRERAARLGFFQTMRSHEKSEDLKSDLQTANTSYSTSTRARGGFEAPSTSSSIDNEIALLSNEYSERRVEGDLQPSNLQSSEMREIETIKKFKVESCDDVAKQYEPLAGDASDVCLSSTELHQTIVTGLTSCQEDQTDTSSAMQDADSRFNSQLKFAPQSWAQSEETVAANADVILVDDEVCDDFDECAPVEVNYAQRYVLAKDRVPAFVQSNNNNDDANLAISTHITRARRILKTMQRLESFEANSKIDTVSKIEVDRHGNSRGSLKVMLYAARDLPTAHLRTKNLDPYACLNVVYPPHVISAHPSIMTNRGFRSQTKKKSIFPVWNEDFEIAPIVSLYGYLHIRVLNDRRLSHEKLVGEVRIPLHTLLHQKRIVEWFSLAQKGSSASADSGLPPHAVSKLCGGAVRLQLQLFYSSVERYKHAVDELVTRYVHDYNELPPFIDSKECEYENENAIAEQPEHEDTNTSLIENTHDQRRRLEVESHRPLDELATSTLQQKFVFTQDTADDIPTSFSRLDIPAEEEYNNFPEEPFQLTVNRPISPDNDYPATEHSKKSSSSCSKITVERRKKPLVSSLTLTVGPHRSYTPPTRVGRIKKTAALQQHTLSPRRNADLPECFDAYSLYRPKSPSLLENCNNERGGLKSSRTIVRQSDVTRKTDLSIFKSPSLIRRPPSSGFPERYIGLDNQTCERLKRIFDRMDRSSA